MRKFIFIIFLSFSLLHSQAQELRCTVQVLSQQIQGTNKQIFKTMQQTILDFMNNTNWTNHVFATEERIECNILINITDQIGSDEFKGTMQIQCSRPVYNSSYNSVLLNYMDNDVHFRYVEYETLEFNENSHTSSLTSLLAFYAYFIIGIDYDSFGYEGGTEFFQMAERIVNNAQNAPEKGWKPFESKDHKNRYWIIQSILEPEFSPIREFYYRYHRLGLDVMDSKVVEGRNQVTESIEKLQEVHRKRPDPFMHFLRIVLDAKADEFVNVYEEGSPEERNRVYRMLTEIDPSNSTKYEKIKEQG